MRKNIASEFESDYGRIEIEEINRQVDNVLALFESDYGRIEIGKYERRKKKFATGLNRTMVGLKLAFS